MTTLIETALINAHEIDHINGSWESSVSGVPILGQYLRYGYRETNYNYVKSTPCCATHLRYWIEGISKTIDLRTRANGGGPC